jgi:hypothetical protein
MGDLRDYKKSLVIIPNSLLGRLLGLSRGSRRGMLSHLLVDESGGGLLMPVIHRMYNDRVGGLLTYALGVRTVGDVEQTARQRRQRDNARRQREARGE